MPQWHGAPASAPPRSFIRKGTPRKGPSGSCGELAAAMARSGEGWITAFSWGFTRSRRARAASTSSRGETAPRRTNAACSVASRAERSSTMGPCSIGYPRLRGSGEVDTDGRAHDPAREADEERDGEVVVEAQRDHLEEGRGQRQEQRGAGNGRVGRGGPGVEHDGRDGQHGQEEGESALDRAVRRKR